VILFAWLRRHHATINGVLITVFTSLIFNSISDNHGNVFSEFGDIFIQLIDFKSLGGIMMLSSLVILIIFNFAFIVVSRHLNRKSFSRGFPDLMKRIPGFTKRCGTRHMPEICCFRKPSKTTTSQNAP